MKTQISRHNHNAKKHYSGVYQQQGRMITDADWNTLVDITKEHIALALDDIVGKGVPRTKALKIIEDAGAIKIKPGHVYLDGVLAQLEGSPSGIGFDEQPDFPLQEGVTPGANTIIYADVWERTVVSLEDNELLDPGLHGADTCSRTQTMLQIKWCDDSFNPEDDAINNPQIGNAELEVILPDFAADVSRADPCLSEASEQPRIGDYLFRLEVHKIVLTHDGTTTTANVTLKWSSENGAEHYNLRWRDQDGAQHLDTSQLPPEFTSGNWTYEFYSSNSEKHLGNHLVDDYTPLYGVLQSDLNSIPAIDGVQADFVRRWDGYLEFSMSREPGQPWSPQSGSVTGYEKGNAIQLDSTPLPAHAWFTVDDGNASLNLVLEGLILKLKLNDHHFVSGDYWLSVVREGAAFYRDIAVDERIKRLNDGLPLGVKHHYLTLAGLDGDGSLIPDESGSEKNRQLDFPPLSNLTADRVAYDPSASQARWEDIKEASPTVLPNTVQEAIDDLVNNLESSDVAYPLPACDISQSVLNLLATIPAWPDLDADGRTTIKDILNALLCHLDARTIPYTTAATETLNDVILNKLTGGDISGNLSVNGNSSVSANLSVGGTTQSSQLRITDGVSGNPQADYVLTAEDSDGNASWKPAPGASWKLQPNGDLVTDPSLVTGNVGIGTEQPAHALHINKYLQNSFSVGIGGDSGRIWTGYQDYGPSLNFYDHDDRSTIRFRESPGTDPGNPLPEYENDPEYEALICGRRGNIGINTLNPAASLHVDGQIYATGAIFYNPVLAERQVQNNITRSSNSYAVIPGLEVTVYVPRETTADLFFSFTRLVLSGWWTGNAEFEVWTDRAGQTSIASFNGGFGSTTIENQSRTIPLLLREGTNRVMIRWREPGTGGTARLEGNQTMRISV